MAATNYLKNVMKSVAYAAVDVSAEYTSGISEFTSTNKEFATATYAALKNPALFVRRQVSAIQQNKIYKALDYGLRNATEDLRTGNFYNKARKERDELSFSGLDTNWDDLSEFGIDDDWEKNLESSSSANDGITAGDMKIVKSIEGSNSALASATVNSIIASSENEIKNSRANTAMLYTQNERLFGGLHKDITVLSSTMQQMQQLQSTSLQNIDKNMSEFFTQESKLSAERNAILKEMLELQRNVYKSASDKEKAAASKKKSNRIRWSDINVNGVVDIGAYFNAVKKNINNQLSSIMPAGFSEDSNMLATFMTSPLEGVMKYVVNGVIPATVKAAAKEFDGTLSGVFGNIIGELGNARTKNEGGLLGTIAKFLGVSTGVNRSIDTSRYEKGPVPFDGITRKAIIDIIPTHLRRIEAVLTGRPEEMFDYKTGRWVKVSNVKKQFDDIKKNAVKRASSELMTAMNPGIKAVRKGMSNKSDVDAWDKAIEEFEQFIYDNNGRFNPKASASKNGVNSANYPNFYRHYNAIKTLFSDFDRIESKDKNGKTISRNTMNRIRMQLSNNVMDAKDSEERQYRDIESDVGNVLNSIFGVDLKSIDKHGKYSSTNKNKFEAFNVLSTATDKLGNTVFDYLQNINKELTYIRSNGIFGGGVGTAGDTNRNLVSMDEIEKSLNKNRTSVTNKNLKKQSEEARYKNNALSAITSGKAIDFRDFSNDERKYLLRLSQMLSEGAIIDYKSEINGYNENEISKFMDKHFYKTNIKSMKDINEAIKKADKEGKNTNEIMDAKEEKFFKKIMNRIGAGESILGGIVGASSEAFTNLLYTADKAIYEMMYKTEISDDTKKKYNGFMDAMVGKMTDKFKDIGDMFKKNVIDPFKERLGIDDDFKTRFKDSLINTGSRLWTSFKDANSSVYSPIIDKMRPGMDYEEYERQQLESEKRERNEARKYRRSVLKNFKNSDTATSKITNANLIQAIKHGTKEWGALSSKSEEANEARRVRSLAIHSGGEILAIWCENNGFTGSLDEKKVRLGSEFGLPAAALARIKTDEEANMVFAKQFKHHAKGTPSGKPFAGLTTLTKGEGLVSSRGFGVVPKTGVYNVTTPTHIINTEDMHSITGGPRVSVQQALGKEKLAAKRAGFNIAHHNKGTGSIRIGKNGEISTDELMEEAKKFIPEAASGGLIGAIVSTLLGIAGGPLLGAAVGAGGSILANSNTLKEKLFGKLDDNNKRDGSGLISKTVVDKFNKYFPDMTKYGLAGIIPGLITPLGPIGGLLVGGAFGYLKNNEKFTNKYFGEEGMLSIKSKEKKIISDLLPGALKGGAAGAVLGTLFGGPFGFLGNAALGSAFGMMASTEEFKDFILGTEINGERMGGMVNAFKDAMEPFTEALRKSSKDLIDAFDNNLIKPLAHFIKPAIHALPIALGSIPKFLSDTVDKFFTTKIGRTVESWAKKIFGAPIRFASGALKLGTGVVNKVLGVPGRLLTKAGDKLTGFNIRHGDTMDMTQREAVEWMDAHGRSDQVSSILRASSRIGSGEDGSMTKEQAESLVRNLNLMSDTEASTQKLFKNRKKTLNDVLNNFSKTSGKKLSDKQVDAILRAARNKDYSSISDILQNRAGLTKAEFGRLMEDEGLKKAIVDIADVDFRMKNIGNVDKDLLEKAKNEFGIDENIFTNKKDRAKAIKTIQEQLLHLEANPDEIYSKFEQENHDNTERTASAVEEILELMRAMSKGEAEESKNAREDVERSINRGARRANEKYDRNISEARKAMPSDEPELQNTDAISNKNNMEIANLGQKIIDNSEGGVENALKTFSISSIAELKHQFTNDAINYLSHLDETDLNHVIKALKNKFINSVLKNSRWEITEKTIRFLSGFTSDNKELAEKCKFLTQIYNKSNGKHIYSRFKSLEEVYNLDSNQMSKLRTEFGVDYTDATASSATNIARKLGVGYKVAKRGGAALVKGGIKVTGFAASAPFKAAGLVKNAATDAIFGVKSDKWYDKNYDYTPEDNPAPEVEQNGLGTFLLGAIGKGLIKGASSLFSSLFGKKDKETTEADKNAGLLGGGLLGLLGKDKSENSTLALPGNTDETDKAGDGKDLVHVGNGDMIQVERDSSGNVQPDTSDSRTKYILNKLELKEKMSAKVQEAQLKMAEVIKNNFDTSGIKESKKGKLGWLSLLLMGGLLWKSGILQKIFNGLIKPVWTDCIKPWIIDTAVPWIKDMWNDKIKPFFTDTVGPWIKDMWTDNIKPFFTDTVGPWVTDTVIPAIGEVLGVAIGTALDTITNNKYNADRETRIDSTELVEKYGEDYETKMYDENGKPLTAGDISKGNYKKIYNIQGVEGTVDSNGKIVFKDKSIRGASYANTVINAGTHAFARSMATGRPGLLTKGASAVAKFFTKRKNIFAKGVGYGTQAITKPIEGAEKLGIKARNGFINDLVDNRVDKILNEAISNGVNGSTADDLLETLIHGDGSKTSKIIQNVADFTDKGIIGSVKGKATDVVAKFKDKILSLYGKGTSEATERAAKNVASETAETIAKGADDVLKAGTKNSGFLSKILAKSKKAIDALFSNSTVKKKLADGAESLGVKNIDNWIKKFKSGIDDIFGEALEKGIKKVGADTCKKVLSKILAVIFLVADFLLGCDRAESILGVTETTVFEEITAGIINSLCELLIIPTIWPGVNYIAQKIYGLFDKDLESRQAEATAQFEKHKTESGSTLTQEQYLRQEYSYGAKIGGWFKTASNILNFVPNTISGGIEKITANSDSGIGKFINNNSSKIKFGLQHVLNPTTWALDLGNILVGGNAEGTIKLSDLKDKETESPLNTMVKNIFSGFNKDLEELTSGYNLGELDATINNAKNGKLSIFSSGYWKVPNKSDKSLKGTLTKSYSMLIKLINTPVLMVKDALDGLVYDIKEIGGILSDSNIAKASSNGSSVSTYANTSSTRTTFGSKVRTYFTKAVNNIKNFFGFGRNTSGYKYGTGIYSKQIDPSIAGVRFNTSGDKEYQTIGDSGCGPAAAVNALESMYGKGNSLLSAAKFAINHGYKELNGGTKPGFFADYFGSKGYGSQTSYNKSDIERNINNGMPTVIMGRDARGVSSSTPFGKTPHYVTVTGTDGRGNAIVQDPESKYDNQLYPIKSLMKNTSLGISAFGKNRRGKWGRSTNTITPAGTVMSAFLSVLMQSKMGEALRELGLDIGSSQNMAQPINNINAINTGDIGYSSSGATNTGAFPTYALNEAQIKGVANILDHEQPGLSGKLAEASLMANLTDIKGDDRATVENLVKKATGGWFSRGKSRFYNPGNPSEDAIKATKAVMLYGRRTVPRYIDEHDCFGDLISVSTDGVSQNKRDRSKYVPFKTKIRNRYKSSYTFYEFPNDKADPFGYTREENRVKWGENHYDVNTAVAGLGKNSKFGRSKWGRGNAEQIWWYLKQMGMTDAGAAGMMGNLEAESGLKFNNAENLLIKRLGYKYTDETYTQAVDSGEIDKENFLKPLGKQYGYGLAQWTSRGRKEGLYDLVKSKNVSIADPATQLEWLGTELNNNYSNVLSVLKTTNNLQQASDIVLSKFEIPANWQSKTAERASKGQKYLNQLRGTTGEEITGVVLPGQTTGDAMMNGTTMMNGTMMQQQVVDNSVFGRLRSILSDSKMGQALQAIGLDLLSSSSSISSFNSNGYLMDGSQQSYSASGDPARMVEIAKAEVGTKERGTNYVKYNDWYWGEGRGGPDLPWCAAFVAWVANQAGISTDIIPKTASTKTSHKKLVERGGKITNAEARAGDIIFFSKDGTHDGIYHTGIVSDHQNGVIHTIEGNSSNMVKERSYDTNSFKVLVARPQYANVGAPMTTIATPNNNLLGNTQTTTSSQTTVSDAPDYSNTRGSNGIKPLSRFGQFKDSIYGRGSDGRRLMHKSREGYEKVEQPAVDRRLEIIAKSDSRKHTYGTPSLGLGTGKYGMGGSPDYSRLINSIISILMTIADNTDKLNLIVSILNNKLNANISPSDVGDATNNSLSLKAKLANALNGINSSSKLNNYSDSIGDSSIYSIISAMNLIAAE